MNVQELWKGFYSIDGKPVQTSENLAVVVHPFYKYPVGCEAINVPYLNRLNDFIQSREGPLITLEGKGRLDKTIEYYKSLGLKKNRFFIETEKYTSHPLNIEWDEMMGYFEDLRNDKPINLAGGFFRNRDKDSSYWEGCLAGVVLRLEQRNIPIEVMGDLVFE